MALGVREAGHGLLLGFDGQNLHSVQNRARLFGQEQAPGAPIVGIGPALDETGIVVDIGRATEALHAVLAELNFRNLDDEPAFAGRNTTTEVLAREIFDRLTARIAAGELGPGADALVAMKVTLHESHAAHAAFEGPLGEDPPG